MPFYIGFEDEAKEMKRFKVTSNKLDVPSDDYMFIENYCFDKDCDCRKVMINAVGKKDPGKFLATIHYGWESAEFYEKWMFGDREIAEETAGIHLETAGIQSEHAQAFLEIFKKAVNNDSNYTESIKKHYKMFKEKLSNDKKFRQKLLNDIDSMIDINSIEEAYFIIATQKEGIPFKAIKYLRNHSNYKDIIKKIVFSLNHAYDDTYYDPEEERYYATPLWLAIVAEKHLSNKLIDPIIKLFTTTNEDWDFLNEQAMYVLGKLAEKYPDLVMKKVMNTVDKMIKEKADFPYLFLFDAFYYIKVKKYKDWFLKTLQKEDFFWRDSFAGHIAGLQIKEAVPIIKDLLNKEKNEWARIELKGNLEDLEKETTDHRPYCEIREHWEKHYSNFEDMFYDDQEDTQDEEIKQAPQRVEKIGRNQPCPCGSDKKYKKCCLAKK